MFTRPQGFSLVETVIALGIFAFCIVVIMGLMPIGLQSARSVANEGNAVNIAESISAGWMAQQEADQPLLLPGIVSNPPIPALSANTGPQIFYFDSRGQQVAAAAEASLRMQYRSVVRDNTSAVEMTFFWPATASNEAAQSRTFDAIFQLPSQSP
jgi:uncharacterized protein (TIGR02598 family)